METPSTTLLRVHPMEVVLLVDSTVVKVIEVPLKDHSMAEDLYLEVNTALMEVPLEHHTVGRLLVALTEVMGSLKEDIMVNSLPQVTFLPV